jgi:hypothetical protein
MKLDHYLGLRHRINITHAETPDRIEEAIDLK